MTTQAITKPELPEQMKQENTAMARQIALLTITDADSYQIADSIGRELKSRIKAITAYFEPMRLAADESKKAILRARDTAIEPLEEAEAHLNKQVSAYRREQQRKQQEEQARRDAEERERVQKQRDEEAAAARAKGREKLAQVIEAAPIEVHAAPVAAEIPKTGSRLTRYWKFRVTDATLVPREFCCPDEKNIGEYVRTNKEKAIDAIPGIEVYPEDKTAW